MKLRWCPKCKRETIQVKKKRWSHREETLWFMPEPLRDAYIKGWYCPQCGSFLVTSKKEDIK